ncbi:unnamed protein product [Arabidopsis lyrata]|nr:unnamed protein product [Arabidopsis lyrata]
MASSSSQRMAALLNPIRFSDYPYSDDFFLNSSSFSIESGNRYLEGEFDEAFAICKGLTFFQEVEVNIEELNLALNNEQMDKEISKAKFDLVQTVQENANGALEEKKLVLGETKKAEHSRKRLPFLTQRKNKPAKKKEENVHATVDIGHNDGQNLIDGWLLEKKIASNDVDLLRDMVWKKDRRIHDTYLDVKDKNERDAISAFLMIHCGD